MNQKRFSEDFEEFLGTLTTAWRLMIEHPTTGDEYYCTIARLMELAPAGGGGTGGSGVISLPINAFVELNRVNLMDGVYNVDGSNSGTLIVTNSYIDGALVSALQIYTDSASVMVRRIDIADPQVYPAWETKSVTYDQAQKIQLVGVGEVFGYALSDQSTNITTGVKMTDTVLEPFTLTSILVSLLEAATGGTFTVDIKKNGVSIFTTKITIDATELTNLTAAVPYVLDATPTTFATGDRIAISIDAVGAVLTGKGATIKAKGTKI